MLEVLRQAGERTEFTATVIGDGPKRPTIKRYLRRHRLADRVQLTGALDRLAIRHALAGVDVFLAPAHRESFGIAALEARTSGVPVLASARSGVGTFIQHGRDGLLASDDREMAKHLVTLLRNTDLRDQITIHNRLVPPVFGWPEALVRHDDLYAAAAASIGVARVVLLGHPDSGLFDGQRADDDRIPFARLVAHDVALELDALLLKERAGVLTTYDAAGGLRPP